MLSRLVSVNLVTQKGRINPNQDKIFSKYPEVLQELTAFTSFLTGNGITNYERIFACLEGVTTQPTCKTCHGAVRVVRAAKAYPMYCCVQCKASNPDDIASRVAKCSAKASETVDRIAATKSRRTPEDVQQSARKREATMVAKYGHGGMWAIEEIVDKRTATNLSRYGAEHASMASSVRQKISDNHARKLPTMDIDVRENLIDLNHNQKLTLTELAQQRGVSVAAVWERFQRHEVDVHHHFKSQPQQRVERWLTEMGVAYESNNRKLIHPYELDIFIPSVNLAIEVNGIFWHSERNGKHRTYHQHKTVMCAKQGINLVQFWDFEINQSANVVQSILRHKLRKSACVAARKCHIVELASSDAKSFCDQNHLARGVNGSVNYGLTLDGQLIAVAAFGKSRFESGSYELYRFCTSAGIAVTGGLSRLLAAFRKQYPTVPLISYSDRRLGDGAGYGMVGFTYVHSTMPNYWYFDRSAATKLMSRQSFQKKKLVNMPSYDANKTEWEIMQGAGYDRVWDCGNFKWILT